MSVADVGAAQVAIKIPRKKEKVIYVRASLAREVHHNVHTGLPCI